MYTIRRVFISLLLFSLLFLSACGATMDLSPGDQEDLDQEDPDPLEVEVAILEEGQGMVYYHYQLTDPNLDFNIETEMPVTFIENTTGSWVAEAIGETEVTFEMMAAGGESGLCQVKCNVVLRFVGQGPVELTEENQCQIPMSFLFVAQEDWILESDCPEEAQAVINCADMSLVMADPGVYTFTKSNPDPTLQKSSVVTQEAQIRNLIMPLGIGELCEW
jgi:hypothetical protein